jgi:hypothetical protein
VFRKLAPITVLFTLLAFGASTALGATKDTATAAASPGPYFVGAPVTFTSTTPCTVACRLTWTLLNGTRLGDRLGEGVSVTTSFSTSGLKTVQLELNELCVGSPRLTCSSFAYVSVFVETAPAPADTSPPTFAMSGLTAEATGPMTPVDYVFSATDPDDAVTSQSCAPAPGSLFAVGSTPISCTATDTHGNVGTETFTVVVSDTTAPALSVPTGVTAEATSASGAAVAFAATAADLVDGAVEPACSPASGSTFALGSTTVDCTATDSHGNSSSASFDVVVTDTTAPALTVPDAITVNATSPAGASVTYNASASDIVDGSVVASCSPASGSVFAIGTTTVSCTSTDAHGNTSPASTFTVRVKGAAEQLADVVQAVVALNLKHSPAGDLAKVAQTLERSTAQGCRDLARFVDRLSGSLGRDLTPAQRAWLTGELARIANVIGC